MTGAPAARPRAAGRLVRLVLSLAISVGLVAWTLRGQDLEAARAAMGAVHAAPIALYLLLQLGVLLVRIVRWGVVVRPLVEVEPGRVARAFIIGTMAVIVLPLRLGELARPLLLAGRRADPDDVARGFATLAMERVADGLAVVAILTVALALAEAPATAAARVEAARAAAGVVGLVFGGALVVLVALVVLRERALALVEATIGRASRRASSFLRARLQAFLVALGSSTGAARTLAALGGTALYWALNGASLQLLAGAFGIELSAAQAAAVLGVTVVAVMVPAGPGMVGTFPAGVVLGVSIFVPEAAADGRSFAFAHAMWILQFGLQVGAGLLALALGGESDLQPGELWRRLRASA